MVKLKKKVEKDDPTKIKSPELPKIEKAVKELEALFKKYKLDPTQDHRKHPIHGKKITELVTIINTNREKVIEKTPQLKKNRSKDIPGQPSKTFKKKKVEKEEPKKKKSTAPVKYDYPLVDGREMTSSEKKKYRASMRRDGIKSGAPTPSSGVKPKKEKKPKIETLPKKKFKLKKR